MNKTFVDSTNDMSSLLPIVGELSGLTKTVAVVETDDMREVGDEVMRANT